MYKYSYSVIIPHFTKKGTELLERAVNSIPQREDIQVIVVDNSPVRIPEDLFAARQNASIFYSDNTKGAGHARNVGIEHANGKWLHFLDADDFFTEGAFDEFDRYRESDYDIVFFKMTSCYSDTLKPARRHIPNAKLIDDFLDGKNERQLRMMEVPWAKMVKASLVVDNNIRFDETRVANDCMFGVKIGLYAKDITADRAVVSCVTINKGSISNVESQINIETRFYVGLRENEIKKQFGYPKSSSVMKYILMETKYGFSPTMKLIWDAIKAGDLFVGWRTWLFTWYKMKFKSDNLKDYTVKE